MMCCSEVNELLAVYVGGGLSSDERARVASHLAVCAQCRSEVARLCRLKCAIAAKTPHELPSGLDPFALLPEEPGVLDEAFGKLKDGFESMELARKTLRLGFELVKIN